MTFPGTPLSCAHEEYVRRSVSHVTRGRPAATHAGQIARRNTLLGEIGLPEPVAKIRSSGPVRVDRACQACSRFIAASGNGMVRRLAVVFGSSNTPSYTAARTCKPRC